MNYRYKIFLPLVCLCLPGSIFATETDSGNKTEKSDENDTEIRLNPTIEAGATSHTLAAYPFISTKANHIDMNGRSWESLREKFENIPEGQTVNIVHIGDSHIQAEGNTSRVRSSLQAKYGDAGRGLIIPFRLAGTNQPIDYRISSSTSMTSAKLLKTPWPTSMGFTGISLAAPSGPFVLTVTEDKPFSRFSILGKGNINVTAVSSDGSAVPFRYYTTDGGCVVELDRALTKAEVTISAPGANIFGIDLRNDRSGVVYSAIGNNGAAFSSYNQIPNFGKGLKSLHPDLVIISLGTNEAFGKISDAAFYNTISAMIDEIRRHNPDAEFLLTTPSECQRSVYTTVRSGRKRRRRSRRVRSFAVNNNVARLAAVIRRFGKEHNIPVYDFYEVAGGQGASAKWVSERLLAGDRIHRTWTGYRLEGDLFHQALDRAIGAPRITGQVDIDSDDNERITDAGVAAESLVSNSINNSKTKAKAKPAKKKTTKAKSKVKNKKSKKKKSKKSRRSRRRR